MRRLIVPTLLAWVFGGSIARADGPMTETAARAWAVADAVLARHVDPPLRQQMFLAGIKGMAREADVAIPSGLARRVSDLSNPEQLAALLADVLAGPKVDAKADPSESLQAPRFGKRSPEDAFFEGLSSAVPGGARVMPEKERKVQESFQANLYVGVQIHLGFDEASKRPAFMKILEGGPAELAGARAGDLIEEVGGESTEGMPLAGVVDRLRGAEGTDVLVRFRRPVDRRGLHQGDDPWAAPQGDHRRERPLPGKRWAVRLDGPEPIGYLKLTEVSGSTPQELRAFAAQLESEGVKALVLDLREAAPAHFHETVLLADALLDGGVIGRVRSVDGEKTYQAEPDTLFRGWPLAVLAAGNPVSEVAWLCAALEDNHRGTIVGGPIVQGDATIAEMVPLPGGEWSVQLATGRLERGDGRPLGVRPPKGPRVEAWLESNLRLTPNRAEPAPAQDRKRDLARAREILAEALKAAAK